MGLTASALPIVWVAAGGRKDLTAVVISTVALVWISQTLTVYGAQYALILMGGIMLLAVMAAPEGFVVSLVKRFTRKHPSSVAQVKAPVQAAKP